MSVNVPCYCTREDAKTALDLAETQRNNTQLDRAVESAATAIEGRLHRRFFPADGTRYIDWPNYQYAYPWRVWFDHNELAAIPTAVSSGGIAIPIANVFFEPVNTGPPFTYMELDRSTNSAYGLGPTPQRSIAITGTFGYWAQTAAAGTLAAAVTDTTGTSISVSSAAAMGVGDVLLIGTERLLVTDRRFSDTGVAFTGPTQVSAADSVLPVADGSKFSVGETIQLDSERMYVLDVAGNNLILKRAWDATVLAAHTSGTIYASRQLTVTRGALGTTAATHLNAAAVARYLVPGLVRDLAVAEAVNTILQETSGYSRTVGEGDNLRPISGAGLADIRARAVAQYGRKGRKRVI